MPRHKRNRTGWPGGEILPARGGFDERQCAGAHRRVALHDHHGRDADDAGIWLRACAGRALADRRVPANAWTLMAAAFLVNFLFWTGLPLGAVAFAALLELTGATWAER